MTIGQTPQGLAARLHAEFGLLLDSRGIMRVLGFRTYDTCIKAQRTGALGIPAFHSPGRPDYFVLTGEFTKWLDQKRQACVRAGELCRSDHTEDRLT
jgi:hypothetical protein